MTSLPYADPWLCRLYIRTRLLSLRRQVESPVHTRDLNIRLPSHLPKGTPVGVIYPGPPPVSSHTCRGQAPHLPTLQSRSHATVTLASLSHAFSHRPALDRHIAPFLRTSVSHPFSHRPALSRAIMPFLTLSRFTLACSPPLACLLTLSHFLPPASCRQPTHGMMSDTQI
jgi:hypothetical protein